MSLGERIRALRLERKLTLQQVADVFGITRASVAGWERGDSRPDQDKLSRLARSLGTTVEYLLTGSITVVRKFAQEADANAEQVRRGMAWVFDRYVTDRSLYAEQEEARAARRGLWADSDPIPPWEWRHMKR